MLYISVIVYELLFDHMFWELKIIDYIFSLTMQ
jgi:hypothetical protein